MIGKIGFYLLTLGISLSSFSQMNMWDDNPANSEQIIDSLENALTKQEGEFRLTTLNTLAEYYWLVDPDYTIKYASEALRLSIQYRDRSQEGLALINLCQGYLFNDLYDKALDYGLRSLKLRKELGNPYDIAFTLRTLGWLYYDIEYYEKALEYHQKVLDIHMKLGEPKREAYSYNSIGLIQIQTGQYEKALGLFNESLKLKRPFGDYYRISETLTNIGVTFVFLHQYDSAIKYLNESYGISNKIDDMHNKAEILNTLAGIYLKQGQYQACRKNFEMAQPIIKGLSDNKQYLINNSKIASAYFEEQKLYDEALEYYKKYEEVNNSILTKDKSHKLAEIQILYEAERNENEIRLLEQERKAQQEQKNALIVGVILVVIIAMLIFSRLKSNIRKNRIIYEKNEQLAVEKLKNEGLQHAKLKVKLEYRMNELTNLALFSSQRTEIFENLSESLRNFDFLDRQDASNKIGKILKEYRQKLNVNQDLQDLLTKIDQLHDEFFYDLREAYPKLTDNDLKLSAQLRMNLSSKEIANINSISVKSVEMSRYRLRKKLGLGGKDSLMKFLQNI